MAKDPTYPMYAQDFDMDTSYWDVCEVGIYTRLLNACWINNGLPVDLNRMSRIARVPIEQLKTAWENVISEKFFEKNGKFFNQRQEEVRAFRLKQKENGEKGGRPKNKPKRNPKETQTITQKEPKQNLSNEIEIEVEIDNEIEKEKGGAGEKELTNDIAGFFKVSELKHQINFRRIHRFVRSVDVDDLRKNFDEYRKYKAESGEALHGLDGWIGNEEINYEDGAWCSCDWGAKLKPPKERKLDMDKILRKAQ